MLYCISVIQEHPVSQKQKEQIEECEKMNAKKLNQYVILGKSAEGREVLENVFAFDREQVDRMFESIHPGHSIVEIEMEKRCSDSVIE